MRQMITRLILAQLVPLAIKAGKKAFRKKKPAVDPNAHLGKAPKLDETDTPLK